MFLSSPSVSKNALLFFWLLIPSMVTLVVTSSSVSRAQDVIEYTQTVKDLGRGGVRIPTETDAGIIFYNPAMLAFTKGIRWSIADLGFGGGCGSCQVSGGGNNPVQNPPAAGNLNSLYGNNVWLGGMGRSALAIGNFGFALYGSLAMDFLVQNPVFPSANLTGFQDYGFVVGGAFNLGPSLAFGANFKRVTRTGGTTTVGAATLLTATINQNFLQNTLTAGTSTGTGYGGDIGLIWKPQFPFNPTVSLCWQDVGYTPFYASVGVNPPPPIEDNLVLGLTAHQDFLGIGWGAGLEYRHINNVDVDLSKKFNAGIELDLALIDARYGFYQGWPGYGLSVDLWLLSFDIASYTVERGAVAGQLPDYRYQVGLSFEAGFDPFFSLSEFGGKKRRLKQRR